MGRRNRDVVLSDHSRYCDPQTRGTSQTQSSYLRSKVSECHIRPLGPAPETQAPRTFGFENQWSLHPAEPWGYRKQTLLSTASCIDSFALSPSRNSSLKRAWAICKGNSRTNLRAYTRGTEAFLG